MKHNITLHIFAPEGISSTVPNCVVTDAVFIPRVGEAIIWRDSPVCIVERVVHNIPDNNILIRTKLA